MQNRVGGRGDVVVSTQLAGIKPLHKLNTAGKSVGNLEHVIGQKEDLIPILLGIDACRLHESGSLGHKRHRQDTETSRHFLVDAVQSGWREGQGC
jgi:hypothetical protein